MSQCIVHPGSREGDPNSYEYQFPLEADSLMSNHRAILEPWFQSFFGLEPAQIEDKVVREWESIEDSGVRGFALALSGRMARSILIRERCVWLVLGHAIRRDDVVRIRAPRALGQELHTIASNMAVPGLDEFLVHFRDLREALWDEANCIWDEPGEFSSSPEEVGEVRDWAGAFQFYCIASGNALLMKPGGEVAKWDHEFGWGDGKYEEVMRPVAGSFAQYLAAYASYLAAGERQRMATPFYS